MLSRHVRPFSTARALQSYIGSAPIPLPSEVSLTDLPPTSSNTRNILVKGPKGDITLTLPTFLKMRQENGAAGTTLALSVLDKSAKSQRSMWGTSRALLNNSIVGVTEGFIVSIKFIGVGYRAAVEGNTVILRVGFSKPVVLEIPKGVSASCPQPTALILEGREKQVVTQFAADIRSYRPPEPYKGKGIFVNNETIKIKSPAGKK